MSEDDPKVQRSGEGYSILPFIGSAGSVLWCGWVGADQNEDKVSK